MVIKMGRACVGEARHIHLLIYRRQQLTTGIKYVARRLRTRWSYSLNHLIKVERTKNHFAEDMMVAFSSWNIKRNAWREVNYEDLPDSNLLVIYERIHPLLGDPIERNPYLNLEVICLLRTNRSRSDRGTLPYLSSFSI